MKKELKMTLLIVENKAVVLRIDKPDGTFKVLPQIIYEDTPIDFLPMYKLVRQFVDND